MGKCSKQSRDITLCFFAVLVFGSLKRKTYKRERKKIVICYIRSESLQLQDCFSLKRKKCFSNPSKMSFLQVTTHHFLGISSLKLIDHDLFTIFHHFSFEIWPFNSVFFTFFWKFSSFLPESRYFQLKYLQKKVICIMDVLIYWEIFVGTSDIFNLREEIRKLIERDSFLKWKFFDSTYSPFKFFQIKLLPFITIRQISSGLFEFFPKKTEKTLIFSVFNSQIIKNNPQEIKIRNKRINMVDIFIDVILIVWRFF